MIFDRSTQYIYEQAIELISSKLSGLEISTKPVLLHCIRVGIKLYDGGYKPDVVLAGFLHDVVEDSDVTLEQIKFIFGEQVSKLVSANTKNVSLTDKNERHKELIKRCVDAGQEAAIVKAADILDNYTYYLALNDSAGIEYCKNNAIYMKDFIKKDYDDLIFKKLFKTVL